ncbi:SHOCT domain-containing protein [Halosimplex rubrum]|uniref:SHOCT domain-containing protein n=1 Tax=Halosimplex rubrum TaxID=869889 RepID=A0A7D5TRT9_9EURY|nr:SHOCT domain-containing protein [Halosimplex rubrum]
MSSTVASVAGVGTLVAGLAALALGVSWFWLVFVVGFLVVAPVAEWLAGRYDSHADDAGDAEPDEAADALAELRDRYARGDIDEAEFERRVERLLETESVDDAESHYGADDTTDADGTVTAGRGVESDRDGDADPEREPE